MLFKLTKGQARWALSRGFCNDSETAGDSEELDDALVETGTPKAGAPAPSADAVCAAASAAATDDNGGLLLPGGNPPKVLE